VTAYNGVILPDLKEGEIALGAVVLTKIMKPNGEITYREHAGESLHAIEMLGMVETFRDTLKTTIMGSLRQAPPGMAGE
jgi:hypothetical protein